ncbi:MAG: hypothetical protein OQL19_21655 [Gammaproteobacteria bacterium]|nr:hypothetical protein [Gammaproteobacteria bacterium]
MEEYLIFFAIGGLLLMTLFVNSVAEVYEQNQREKRIKILRIKQSLDELSDLLDGLKSCDISDNIRNLIANEIMVRLQTIQSLDKNFRGIQALIEEAKEETETATKVQSMADIKDENEFKKRLIKLGRLIRILNSHNWFSRVKRTQLHDYLNEVKLLRCEKIFQFYSDMASSETEKEHFLIAKEHYYYIIHALKGSGINSHPRITELTEQANFMLDQMNKMFSENTKKKLAESFSEELGENEGADAEESNSDTENPQAEQPPTNTP